MWNIKPNTTTVVSICLYAPCQCRCYAQDCSAPYRCPDYRKALSLGSGANSNGEHALVFINWLMDSLFFAGQCWALCNIPGVLSKVCSQARRLCKVQCLAKWRAIVHELILKGTPSIPETYLSSSVAWGLNLRVGWWRQILKKCKFSNGDL